MKLEVHGIQFDLLFASLNDPLKNYKKYLKNPSAFKQTTGIVNEITLNSLQGKAAAENITNWLPNKRSKLNF